MTRADAIREIVAEYPEATLDSVANCVENRGFDRPSRQAIESALAKSGERGRPTERAKCPLCGTRVDVDECTTDERERFELLCETRGYRPIDIVRVGLHVVGDAESGDRTAAAFVRESGVRNLSHAFPPKPAATVATVSQTPKRKGTKRTPRTISRSKK